MPSWLQALLLGIVQGLTEFLPVSSSGHLVLAQAALGDSFFAADNAVLFDLVLHLGTLLPVLVFYRHELVAMLRSPLAEPKLANTGSVLAWLKGNPDRWLATLVVAGTVPTGLMGVLLKDFFESLFHSVYPVAGALLVTAAVLVGTRFVADRAASPPKGVGTALLVGVAQGLAITPGISRSGSTIAAGLFLGLDRESAARFSFLLSIPAILGALVLQAKDGVPVDSIDWMAVFVGFVGAAVSGYAALVFLVALVKRGGLHRFAWYLVPAAVAAAVFLG